MRFGALRSGAMFVTAFAAMFAALSVGAPAAKSQVGLLQRMTFMHHNPQLHFSIVDPTQPPTPAASEVVGKFISATAQSSKLIEGHAYPSHVNPDYLYGVTSDGYTIRRVGQTGSPIDTTNFGNLFSRVTGAWLVTNDVPVNPQWIPRAYDLKEHFVVVGEVSQQNPSLAGNTTGMMMINPKTMAGYNVGQANMFLGPAAGTMFEDVCFGVYPGPDADYSTTTDNEYRYVMFMSNDQSDEHQLFCLSLTEHETMNGTNPPDPWNPVAQERGPSYTNVYPVVTANPHTANQGITAVDNGQMYVRSYYARPELAALGFNAPTDVSYFIAGWVVLAATNPNRWVCVVQGFTMGADDPLLAVTPGAGASALFFTDDIFKGMHIVGDWIILSVGDGNAGDGFADDFRAIYLPEFFDGFGDGDSGFAGLASKGAGTVGFAGYHVSSGGHPEITYLGAGAGQSVVAATTRDPFTDHPRNNAAGLINDPLTNIDMHTEEEKLLGINIRRAPQPFVGYWFSEDPASNFPGFRDGSGGGDGSGGCSGSAGGGAGTSVGLLALMGMAFLMVRVLRESAKA
jgi:hypothetical protein